MKSPRTLTIAASLAASSAAPVMAQSYPDSEYQQRIAGAVAAGVAALRSKLEAAR